jgi:anti-sigma regulatory factor (Ser/Thr protein kinase)
MKFFHVIFLFLISISFTTVAGEQDTIVLKDDFKLVDNNLEKYYFSKQDIPIQEVTTAEFKVRDSINFSYITGWVWVKFVIKNESDNKLFVLSSTATQISGYYMYKPEGSGYVLTPPKRHHPEDGREVNSNLPSFYLNLQKGETQTFYLKIRVEEEVIRCNFIIQNSTRFVEYSQINYLILGVYFGVLIIIILVNIFYSIALKDSLFLVYALYIISVFAVTLTFEGFVWMMTPNSILAYHICYFCLRLWSDALLFFTMRLVNLKNHYPLLYKIAFAFLLYHEVIMAALQLTDAFNMRLELIGKWEMINCLLALSLVFIVIIRSYKNNKYLFKYYIIGLGAIVLSITVFPLYSLGYLKNYVITEHSVKIGTLIEIIALSFAVSRRFRLTENALRLKKEEEKQFNEKIKELETNIRKAQMNPHFMFNALTSIEYFISKNDAWQARTYLNNFAQLMRLTLDNSRDNYISLQDDLDALKFYIELEFLRLQEHGHRYEINVESGLNTESIVIPALLIQPFVENAIWHGLQKKKSKGKLLVSLSIQEANLQCIIEDDGGGIKEKTPTTPRKSSGILITKERLTLIHAMLETTYRFEMKDVVDEKDNTIGTRILFYIPYKKD